MIGVVDVTILVTATIFMVLLQFLVYRTKLGAAMRAVSFEHQFSVVDGNQRQPSHLVYICSGIRARRRRRFFVCDEVSGGR